MPQTAAEAVAAAQYTNQSAGSISPYPGKRGRGRPRKVPRPGDVSSSKFLFVSRLTWILARGSHLSSFAATKTQVTTANSTTTATTRSGWRRFIAAECFTWQSWYECCVRLFRANLTFNSKTTRRKQRKEHFGRYKRVVNCSKF